MNAVRGEVGLVIDGQERRLVLTLGALAEIQTALGAESLGDLATRLGRFSAVDLVTVLEILLRAGGDTVSNITEAKLDPGEAAKAVARTFEVAFSS